MLHWKKSILPPCATLLEVMTNLNETGTRIVNIVDQAGKLKGIITDGDLRRALVKGLGMGALASQIMRVDFFKASLGDSNLALADLMRSKGLLQIPVLDGEGRIVEVKFLANIMAAPVRENWVLLMAGGLGSRLMPLTANTPKPLLPVGGKPILQNILEALAQGGFRNFFISVNYLADKIEDYFGDGSQFGVKINYLREQQRLGTAGAMGLLPELPTHPMLVMNGDVLTRLNFGAMLDFHNLNSAAATMGVREYDMQVPYGVIQTEGNRLIAIVEKPVQHYFVNAGVYVLSPAAVDLVPERAVHLDMPTLFENLMSKNLGTAAYPIREYWLDIGRPEDLEKANQEYDKLFADNAESSAETRAQENAQENAQAIAKENA